MTPTSKTKLTVALIDDHPLFITGVTQILMQSGHEVIWSGESPADLLASGQLADVALVDLALRDGMTSAQDITNLREKVAHVIVLTGFPDHDLVVELLLAGAVSVVAKNTPAEELVATIEESINEAYDITPLIAATLAVRQSDPLIELSTQEARVLALYGSGMKLAAVGHHLGISVNTVKEYLRRVRKKLAAVDRDGTTQLDLNREARRLGVLPD